MVWFGRPTADQNFVHCDRSFSVKHKILPGGHEKAGLPPLTLTNDKQLIETKRWNFKAEHDSFDHRS